MAVFITRRETFAAGHRLFNPSFSETQNREVFGSCSNPSGHGHNYVLEVTIEGEIANDTGYVMDLGSLGDLVRKRIIDHVDHSNLNTDVGWLQGRNPTAEVLASAFWDRLEDHLPPGALYQVKLIETEKNWAERRRDS